MNRFTDNNRFGHLVSSLENGWEIEQPVLLGTMWHTNQSDGGAYHFVLKKAREDKTTLLSLPPSAQLLLFLSENNITIKAL